MTSVGEILRNSRLHKEWTPEAASRVTKIRVPQLLALERNDFSKFAAPAYARGFVRIYARCLGLDEKAILSQLDGTFEGDDDDMFVHAPPVDYVPERINLYRGSTANEVGWKIVFTGFLVFLVILGICIGGYWQLYRNPSQHTTMPGLRAPAPGSSSGVPAATPVVDTSAPGISTASPDVPVAPKAGAVDVPIDTAAPATPADGIPTARPVVEAPAATAAKDEPYTMLLTSKKAGLQIGVVSTTKKGKISQTFTLNIGQSQEFRGSYFIITSSVPNATHMTWNGEDYGMISDDTSVPTTYDMPPKNN